MGTLSSLIDEVLREDGPAPREAAFVAGDLLGRYELVRELGRGGFGVVWEAIDRDLGRRVAVKSLRVSGSATREKRLLAEAEVAARLQHPNIATIFDVGRATGSVFVVQELLTGRTLAEHLQAGGLALREVLRLAIGICSGLAHAHENGVVHRDLSASNVQVCDDGQVKLIDLGMASAAGRRALSGGTPAFMAPEQVRGSPEDERTDVYALGVLLGQLLVGPAAGGTAPRVQGLSVPEAPELGALVESMLATEPTDRPRDARQVLDGLAAIERSLNESVAVRPARARATLAPQRRSLLRGALLGLALAGTAAAALSLVAARRASPGAAQPFVAGAQRPPLCTWKHSVWKVLEGNPEGAVLRNGKLDQQGPGRFEGWPVWEQRSDWNILYVPIGDLQGDLFAVAADFLLPASGASEKGVGLVAFTGPAGPDPSWADGGLGLYLEERTGSSPTFSWGLTMGPNGKVDYKAPFPLTGPVSGKWRTIVIEGSRSKCWLRASVDAVPLVFSGGQCGALRGRYVALTSSNDAYRPVDVRWRNLTVSAGGPGCE